MSFTGSDDNAKASFLLNWMIDPSFAKSRVASTVLTKEETAVTEKSQSVVTAWQLEQLEGKEGAKDLILGRNGCTPLQKTKDDHGRDAFVLNKSLKKNIKSDTHKQKLKMDMDVDEEQAGRIANYMHNSRISDTGPSGSSSDFSGGKGKGKGHKGKIGKGRGKGGGKAGARELTPAEQEKRATKKNVTSCRAKLQVCRKHATAVITAATTQKKPHVAVKALKLQIEKRAVRMTKHVDILGTLELNEKKFPDSLAALISDDINAMDKDVKCMKTLLT